MVLLFFDFGSGEIMLIILAIFLIFGPDKIPGLARNMGKFINEIKHATDDIKKEINLEADRQEREKKLEKYTAQIKADLEPEKTEKRETASKQEKIEPDIKDNKKDSEDKGGSQ